MQCNILKNIIDNIKIIKNIFKNNINDIINIKLFFGKFKLDTLYQFKS